MAIVRDGIKLLWFLKKFSSKGMVHLNLQLLYDCNFSCKICEFWKAPFKNSKRLSAADAYIIAKKLKPYGPMIVSLGGGEPLLHDELVEIVKIFAKDNFPVMICNGWFVTAENARSLFKAGLYEASVSVDYIDPERHDAQRGRKGAFEKAVSALRLLHENRVNPWQRVHMISVLMDDNLDDIEPLVQLSRNIGITYLLTFYSSARGRKENRKIPAEVSSRLLEIHARNPEFVALPEFLRRFSEATEGGGIQPCYAGKNLFNVDCHGNVTRCIDRLANPVGNLLSDDAGSIFRKLSDNFTREPCGDCWTSCRGSVESLMYGENRLSNLAAYYKMTKPVPLTKTIGRCY